MTNLPTNQTADINITKKTGQSDDHTVNKAVMNKANQHMPAPSQDWTKLANVLRRAAGGFSRSR